MGRARTTWQWTAIAALLLLSALNGACRKASEPLHLKSIAVGTQIDAQQRVVAPADLDFAFPKDAPVYASIGTDGSGSGTLRLTWAELVSGRVHTQQEQLVTADGPAFFAFSFMPPGGWPLGRHTIIFALDEDKHSREFTVR